MAKKKNTKKTKTRVQTKVCRDCGERKKLTTENFSKLSSACKTPDGYMPACKACRSITPIIRHTVGWAKKAGRFNSGTMAAALGYSKSQVCSRISSALKVGLLERVGYGIYKVTAAGKKLSVKGARETRGADKPLKTPVDVKALIDDTVTVNIQGDTQHASDMLHLIETAELNSENKTIAMQVFRRLSGLPQSQYAPESGILMEV